MIALRRLLVRRPALAAIVLAAALLLRILVPTGFMPLVDHGRIVVAVCNGTGPMTMVLDLPGAAHHDDDAMAKGACAFADLALPVIGGADPIQLAAALVFVLALGLVLALTLPRTRAARWRPPLRGPPTAA